ncbi:MULTISPECIES: response regulator [Marilutibacter]|uniref:Response regulator n=1 Tax=Marilutibacter spongiae TaxID=2025720 RepID=A0A7W3Y5R9_9GAMM|nr:MULTISPECIES: response regulator [Lysobacter]MBB1060226.1 response regulator [Lysobacter spongiae]
MNLSGEDGGPLRLLLIEDSADDAELTTLELADAGIEFHYVRVQDEHALLRALDDFNPQCVLSDLNLPGFSGEQALELVRTHAPRVPFVYVSDGWLDDLPAHRPGGLAPADAQLPKSELQLLPGLLAELLQPR